MAKTSCCCSRVLSCFSCFSARNNPTPPPYAVPFSAPTQRSSSGTQVVDLAPHDGSSSSAVQTRRDIIDMILNDAHAGLDGENGQLDAEKLDGLLSHISQLMKLIEEGKESPPAKRWTGPHCPTTSTSFTKLREFLSEAINVAKDLIPSDGIKTVVNGVLQGMGIGHMVTTCFLVVANILQRFEDIAENKTECLTHLKEMLFLAKLVKQFYEQETQEIIDVIKKATGLIVEGSILCCTQMKSSKFSKFWAASATKDAMSKFSRKLRDMYTHMNAAPKKPRLSRRYPEHAGIDEPMKEVIELLEWKSQKTAVAVMLLGIDGIGKTTLADAVFSRANFEGCKYSEVRLFKTRESKPDILELQKYILNDLMGPEGTIPDIRKYEDGQRELGVMLKKVQAFIYIDNVLGENELGQLLPTDLNTCKKVRLLLTAHDINVGRACPRKTEVKTYTMKSLPDSEAMRLLKGEALDDMEAGKLNSNELQKIIEKCGGNPEMLTLASKVIGSEEDKERAYDMVMEDKQNAQGKGDYFFAYDSLPEKCKDPFLDVCSFFDGWEWDTVADIVGEEELNMLQKRALVGKDTEGAVEHVHVHDVILTLAHQKAENTRLKLDNASQIDEFLKSKEDKDLQNIKGLSLGENKDPSSISASVLDSMSKSLRFLCLGNLIQVDGQCNNIFENLVCFQGGITHLPFQMSKNIKCFTYDPEDLTLDQMPSAVRSMDFRGRLRSQAFQIPSTFFQQLGNLRILKLMKMTELKTLPEELGDQIKGLRELCFSYCRSMENLPTSISRLKFLRVLKLEYCSSLRRLPEMFSNLESLEVLRLDYCLSLRELPDNFGSLQSLQELNLQGCMSLEQLGEDFGSLNSLQNLNLQGCTDLGLEALPRNLENLSSLKSLNLPSHYKNLQDLPPRFVEERPRDYEIEEEN